MTLAKKKAGSGKTTIITMLEPLGIDIRKTQSTRSLVLNMRWYTKGYASKFFKKSIQFGL
jgi:hypothetical protein